MIPALIIGGAIAAGTTAANLYNDSKNREAAEASRAAGLEQLTKMLGQSNQSYDQMLRDLKGYYENRGSLGSASDVAAYRDAISGYNPEDYAADIGKFSYDKTKEDFLNPYYSRIIGDTAETLQHTAAGAGLGRGTGAALNIAKGVAEKSDDLYKTAMSEYRDDRNFSYQQFQDAIANNQNRLNALRDSVQYKLGLQGSLASDYYNTMDARQSDILKIQQDKQAAAQAYGTSMASLY